MRLRIRDDFPKAVWDDEQDILGLVTTELQKQGTSLSEVKRINVAFPYKGSWFYRSEGEKAARHILKMLEEKVPEVEWIPASCIYEKTNLNRGNRQHPIYSLTAKHTFGVNSRLQKNPFPFLDAANDTREYFLVVDKRVCKGTTAANLISFIEHNGGYVLGVGMSDIGNGSHYLRQRNEPWRDYGHDVVFEDKEKYYGRVPVLADVFKRHAYGALKKLSADQLIDTFNERLKRYGLSVYTLTEEEAIDLSTALRGGWDSISSTNDLFETLELFWPWYKTRDFIRRCLHPAISF